VLLASALEDAEGIGLAGVTVLACKGKPRQQTQKTILYKLRIIYVKLLSVSKIHASSLIDIVGSKTPAYKDTFKKESSGSGLILGNRLRKAGCQEHVSQLARLPGK